MSGMWKRFLDSQSPKPRIYNTAGVGFTGMRGWGRKNHWNVKLKLSVIWNMNITGWNSFFLKWLNILNKSILPFSSLRMVSGLSWTISGMFPGGPKCRQYLDCSISIQNKTVHSDNFTNIIFVPVLGTLPWWRRAKRIEHQDISQILSFIFPPWLEFAHKQNSKYIFTTFIQLIQLFGCMSGPSPDSNFEYIHLSVL